MTLMPTQYYQLSPKAVITFLLALLACSPIAASQNSPDCVVLLHGLGRTANSMSKIEDALTGNGYRVWNESYPSTKHDVQTLAPLAIEPALDFCAGRAGARVHFVTHSLGGILVRFYLQDRTVTNLGNIVMIAPPNRGSEVVDLMKELALFELVLGPAATQLGTEAHSIPNSLQPLNASVGIIAGTQSLDPWFSGVIEGQDDGKVSVESTALPEAADMVTVEHGHAFIMRSKNVIELINRFLETGSFDPGS